MIKLFLALFICFNSFAAIFVEVVMTHEKDFEGQTILKSELHFVESVQSDRMSRFIMKSKTDLLLSGRFIEVSETYGPDSLVEIEGRVLSKTLSKNFKLDLRLGNEGEVVFSEPELGQKTKIIIRPIVK